MLNKLAAGPFGYHFRRTRQKGGRTGAVPYGVLRGTRFLAAFALHLMHRLV